jgi:hypothetical protein
VPGGLLVEERRRARRTVDQRDVVVHGSCRAQRGARFVHGQTVMSGVVDVLFQRHLRDPVRQRDQPLDGASAWLGHSSDRVVDLVIDVDRLGVELDETVVEGHLEVDEPLVRRECHRAHRRTHVGMTGLGELLADLPALGDREVVVVHDLKPAITFDGVMNATELDRPQRRAVDGRIDPADGRMKDPRAIAGIVVLMGGLAGREGAQPVAHRHLLAAREGFVDHRVLDDLLVGGVGDHQPSAIG